MIVITKLGKKMFKFGASLLILIRRSVHLTFAGRARIASSQVGVEELKKDAGVETLLVKLDSLFLPEKERRQFSVLDNIHSPRRTGCLVKKCITEFEHQYFKF